MTFDDLINWFKVNKTLIFRYGSKLIGPSIWIYHDSQHRFTLSFQTISAGCRPFATAPTRWFIQPKPTAVFGDTLTALTIAANATWMLHLYKPVSFVVAWGASSMVGETQNGGLATAIPTEVCVRLLQALHSLPRCKNRCPPRWEGFHQNPSTSLYFFIHWFVNRDP